MSAKKISKNNFNFKNQHSQNKPEEGFLIEENELLALPSESDYEQIDHLLAHDGHIKNSSINIIKRGSKVNNEFNSDRVNTKDYQNRNQSLIGRKNNKVWSADINGLKKRFGFSWAKLARRAGILILIISVLSAIGVTGMAGLAIDYWENTPSIERLDRDPSQSSVVYARDGKTKIFEFFKEEKREIIEDINEIPDVIQLAIVVLEDENYWDPNNDTGIPWRNLAGATRDCFLTAGGNCRGASGISQQLIKNITDDDDRSVDRKLRELFTAVKLNQSTNKTQIILEYMNWVPFGRNAYGVQEASKAYFGRPVNARDPVGEFLLSAPEACYLAAMIQRPSYYESGIDKLPFANQEKLTDQITEAQVLQEDTLIVTQEEIPNASYELEDRKDACLTKLYELELPLEDGFFGNYIETKEELETLIQKPVASTTSLNDAQAAREAGAVAFVNLPVEDPYPHFREYITSELTKFISERDIYEEGYNIITTLDPETQANVERIVKESEDIVVASGGDNAAAVVLDGPTGEIVAMVGSLGYEREDIDGKVNITTSPQQPGSSVKPYTYANAFDNGFNPATVITDVQTSWGPYTPKNFDNDFRGPVTMRRALQGSLNIPAVKTLFLVNNDPPSNQISKLDDFFGYTEDQGVVFPCVEGASNILFAEKNNGVETCVPNEEKNITQEDVDNAYRGRCYIASTLGGCELTMISHATGINTFLQDGNRRTATPFLSIVKKTTGENIYRQRQDGPDPVYPMLEATEEQKLIARQLNNVMSDSNSRIPEFGSLRFNLQMNDSRWQVAAKTGTSNGPRDFWTVGGSTYNTVVVWTGTTDNRAMNRSASSSRSAAPIWKEIMEYVHQNKEPTTFSTEGLQRYFVRTGGSKDEAGEVQYSGQSELLTPNQIKELNSKSGVIAVSTPEELDIVKKKSIFDNRTTLVPTSFSINKLDGKLFVPGLTLEPNREEVVCTQLVSEFPDPSWSDPVAKWAENSANYCTIPEPSDQNQLAGENEKPIITTNLTSNSTFSSPRISVSSSFPEGSSKTVVSLVLKNNDQILTSTNNNNLTYSTSSLIGQNGNISIEIKDNFDNLYVQNYPNINFIATNNDLRLSDISNLSCNSVPAKSLSSCSFKINPNKNFSTLRIQIEGSNSSASCSVNGNEVNCSSVQTPQIANSAATIRIIINNVSYNSSKTVAIT